MHAVAIRHVETGAAGGVVVGRVVGEDVGVGFANDDVGGSTVGGEVD
jgi:hypothetical protein